MAKLESNGERLMLRADVVATVMEDGAVLLDLESKYFYSVNSTGWSLLQDLELGATASELREASRSRGASGGDLHQVDRFLEALLADGLVEPTPGGPASGFDSSPAPSGPWIAPTLEKHREPLQKVMTSAFDPSLPLAE